MKNKDVLFYEIALRDVRQKGVDFTATISRNREMAEKEARHLREVLKPDNGMVDYRKEMQEMQDKFTKKNAEGTKMSKTVVIDGDQREVPDIIGIDDPESEYAKGYAEIQDKYATTLSDYEKIINDFNANLDKDNDNFRPIMIGYDEIPQEISQDEMDIIWNLIDKDTMPDKFK
jgi:hypothetical protein